MPWPVSDRIMTIRLPLGRDNFATIISMYAPTMTHPDEIKKAFYNQLASVLSGIPCTDKLLLIGDFNARIGRYNEKWPLVMMGLRNATPMASFYWLCARSSN